MSAEAWTILGTGGALFVGLAGLAVAIWRSLDARLELMAQQHAAELQVLRGDLRDLRADHGTRLDRLESRLDRLDARQFEMAQALARIEGRQEQQSAAVASTPASLQELSRPSAVATGETRPE
ncbi:MAG: hypothetical protein F4Y02_05430 [Chloroflexi bacterium]|nr:hypothetical protein [Chloroflexota bacterium]